MIAPDFNEMANGKWQMALRRYAGASLFSVRHRT
jgi:hypothetical protein